MSMEYKFISNCSSHVVLKSYANGHDIKCICTSCSLL